MEIYKSRESYLRVKSEGKSRLSKSNGTYIAPWRWGVHYYLSFYKYPEGLALSKWAFGADVGGLSLALGFWWRLVGDPREFRVALRLHLLQKRKGSSAPLQLMEHVKLCFLLNITVNNHLITGWRRVVYTWRFWLIVVSRLDKIPSYRVSKRRCVLSAHLGHT